MEDKLYIRPAPSIKHLGRIWRKGEIPFLRTWRVPDGPKSGPKYKAVVELVRKAKHYIHMQKTIPYPQT